ncbi:MULTISPECIES: type II secretion system protein N [unclassified Marinovum]
MTAKKLWLMTVLAVAGVSASLVWQANDMGWLRLARVSTLPPAILAPLNTATAAAPNLAAIRDKALFGQQARSVQTATAAVTAPVKLDVFLRGVFAYHDSATSRAFISDGKTTASFRIGEAVAQGAVLTDVMADSVMLEIDGIPRELGFDGLMDQDGADTAPEVADASASPITPMDRLAAALRTGSGSIDLRDAPPPETVDQYIDMWRGRIQRDPAEVMKTIGVEQTGRGYRITQDPDIGVTLAGLQPGDIVTRLNGQTVGNVDKDRLLYDQVATAGVARLEVERSGETLLMTFSLK